MRLQEGLSELDAHGAIQKAEFEVAKRLAEITGGLMPEHIEQYELQDKGQSSPRVVLIQGCLTDSQQSHSGVSYYGMPIRDSLATLIHPNELLDGAVATNTTRGVAYSRSEEHTSELQSLRHLVCRLLLEKKNNLH